jgi:F0F1-type ATP synthase assembly protein I
MTSNLPKNGKREPLNEGSAEFAGGDFGRYAGLGLQFALVICLLTFAGYALDEKLGTLPLFLIVGVLAGFVGGLISIVKKVPPPSGSRRKSS